MFPYSEDVTPPEDGGVRHARTQRHRRVACNRFAKNVAVSIPFYESDRRPRNRLLSLVLCEYTTALAGTEVDSQPGLDNRIKGQRGLRAARHWRYASVTARTRDPIRHSARSGNTRTPYGAPRAQIGGPIRCMLDATSVPDAKVPRSIV